MPRQCCAIAGKVFFSGNLTCCSSRLPYRCLVRDIHLSKRSYFFRKKQQSAETRLALREEIFKSEEIRNREGFIEVIERFKLGNENRKGHVEFINASLKYLEEFNVHQDITVYKMLFDLFPKGKFPPTNMIQAEFQHFPYHQDCGVRLLDIMEYNGNLSLLFSVFHSGITSKCGLCVSFLASHLLHAVHSRCVTNWNPSSRWLSTDNISEGKRSPTSQGILIWNNRRSSGAEIYPFQQ